MTDWVQTWDVSQVKAFRTNNVDGAVLLTLDEKDLTEELGFTAAEASTFIKKLGGWVQVWDTTVPKRGKAVCDLMEKWAVDQ
eukprot:scaffold47747_cov46-Prasinocladus_malaysianus.AAC.1